MEVCHNIEPFLNPTPVRNPGGDCFACALTAALRWLYPDKPPTFDQAFEYWRQDNGYISNTWPGLRAALYKAHSDGYRMEITSDIVEPKFDSEHWSHPWLWQIPEVRYAHRLEGWLRGGWIAFTEINLAGGGALISDGRYRATDHFVLFDGIRSYWKPFEGELAGKGASRAHDVHVICSRKGAYWTPLIDFLRDHGAGGWWLCRRDEREL